MQIFPQSSQSAKMFGNNSSNAYSNNQAESAKGLNQAIEMGQYAIQAIMALI